MDPKAYESYANEAENWLKRGRARLLRDMVEFVCDGGEVESLEVGAGVGQNISDLAAFGDVDAVEINEVGLESLRKHPELRTLYDRPIPFELDYQYDFVCALDVIEHLEDDRGAVEWMTEHIRPGGHLFLTVPAFNWLFSEHDEALGHYRRYTRSQLESVLPSTLQIVRSSYFNSTLFPAAAASRLIPRITARFRPKTGEPKKQSSNMPGPVDSAFFSILRGEAKAIQAGMSFPAGLSAVCLARKV